MKMVKLVCPHCGATLSIGDGIDSFYCQFCGGKILLTEQDKNTLDAKVKLKEFEHKERLKSEELSYQERLQKSQQEHELRKIAEKGRTKRSNNRLEGLFILPLILLLILIMCAAAYSPIKHQVNIKRLYSIEEQLGNAISEHNYERALFLANQLYCSDGWSNKDENAWNERREYYFSLINEAQRNQLIANPDIIFAPVPSDYIVGKNYTEIMEYLSSVGFTNISTHKAAEAASRKHPENTIEHILIGGKNSFTTEDYFDKDTPIIIYYYSK